jgi:hypothetical protein
VVLVVGSAQHCSFKGAPLDLRWNRHAAPLAGDGGVHKDLCLRAALDENTTVAALKQVVNIPAATSKIEALGRDAVGRVRDGAEHDLLVSVLEDAE